MPRKLSNALDALTVKNAAPGRHADGGGLHLLVKETGARSWVYRFTLKGKSRDIGLGAAGKGGVSLSGARDLAAALRLKVRSKIDPLDERNQEAAKKAAASQAAKVDGITFRAVAEAHIKANEKDWANAKHQQQWRNTMTNYVYPVMGDLAVAAIDTAHVLAVIEPIWRDKRETASRIRGRIEAVLDAARARGYRQGDNPARWRGHIASILPKRSQADRGHHTALAYDAIPAFMGELRARVGMSALALEFSILTASRTNEVLGATWNEVDLAKGVWTVPASRMKAKKEHRVPLSPRAVEILESVKPLDKGWLFASSRGGRLSNMAMSMLLRRMGQDCTVHGFRSGFRDWSAECTGYAHEVCEMALAHTIANKAEAAYRRGDLFDKRRRLMADWATYCEGIGIVADGVFPMRGAVG